MAVFKIGHTGRNHLDLLNGRRCCEAMQEAIVERVIGLTYEKLNLNLNAYYNKTIPQLCVHHTFCYPEGPVVDYTPIRYCPFCGKKIKMVWSGDFPELTSMEHFSPLRKE